MPSPATLRFESIRRRFGRLAVLEGVSGAVTAGGALLVTGRNGSGKSTLLRCLAGLLVPDAGSILYDEGDGALDIAVRRHRVGFISPDLSFYGELTVAENLAFFARLRRAGARAGLSRGLEVLDRLGLPPDRRAATLSSGMRQRLRWAWALMHRPRLLLLDEPFQNLDAAGEQVCRELLHEHLAGSGFPDCTPGLAVVANPHSLEIDLVAGHLDLGR